MSENVKVIYCFPKGHTNGMQKETTNQLIGNIPIWLMWGNEILIIPMEMLKLESMKKFYRPFT